VFAAKVAIPQVKKQRVGSSDIVLRLRRSDCSRGLVGHTVAYRLSYCTARADTGEFSATVSVVALHCDNAFGCINEVNRRCVRLVLRWATICRYTIFVFN